MKQPTKLKSVSPLFTYYSSNAPELSADGQETTVNFEKNGESFTATQTPTVQVAPNADDVNAFVCKNNLRIEFYKGAEFVVHQELTLAQQESLDVKNQKDLTAKQETAKHEALIKSLPVRPKAPAPKFGMAA